MINVAIGILNNFQRLILIFDIVFNFYKERQRRKLTKVVDQVNSDYDKLYDLMYKDKAVKPETPSVTVDSFLNMHEQEEDLTKKISNLLREKKKKLSVSDIDAFLKHQNVNEIKELCEKMYQDGEISFAGNGRYFVLTEEKEKPNKAAAKEEKVDVEKELKKLKALLDKGLITQEQYDSKSNKLLGLG